jgi:hypothetical protein
MNNVFVVLMSSLIFLVAACSSGRPGAREQHTGGERYKSVAAQKLGPNAEFLFNEQRTAVLCLGKPTPTSERPQRHVFFFVFDLSSDSTIFQDEIVDGSVIWKDNFSIQVTSVPGIVKADEPPGAKPPGYIFDLRSRKTKALNAVNVE